jgi:hypothetical protein
MSFQQQLSASGMDLIGHDNNRKPLDIIGNLLTFPGVIGARKLLKPDLSH